MAAAATPWAARVWSAQGVSMSSQDIPSPLPRVQQFESMAFGIFVHFGLYSLLKKGEWAMHLHNIPRDEYMKLMDEWAVPDFDGRAL